MRLELYLEGTDEYSQGWNAAMSAIATANVHAHWKPVHLTAFGVCSACGAKWQFTELMSFCPNCGAHMDERSEDE